MLLRLLSTLLLSSPDTGACNPLGPAPLASSSAGLLGVVDLGVVDLGLLVLGVPGALGPLGDDLVYSTLLPGGFN